MNILEATEADLDRVMRVEAEAFGYEKEALLVRELLHDETAKPLLSLLAIEGDEAIGHILFTKVRLNGTAGQTKASILAPLAIVPSAQNKGVGGVLIREGLRRLAEADVALVFVLGHPGYYPRHGFQPAGVQGFEAPYPIPQEHASAWMVQELRPAILGSVSGKVICADALDRPEHWRE